MKGRVLIIAGSDSGGGAGLQADIKAVTMLNGYAMTAVTALTAQNTLGVHAIEPVPLPFIARQIRVVADDLGVDAIKTGMLGTAEVVQAVCAALDDAMVTAPLVVDPVMVAKGGASLLERDAVESVRTLLVPRATLVTPNLPEAAALAGHVVTDEATARRAGDAMLRLGAKAALIKGGHGSGDLLTDWLVTAGGARPFTAPRIHSRHTHGTGCTLASAIACGLAQGLTLGDAIERARAYVQQAIRTAPGYGAGHGPLNHAHPLDHGGQAPA